MIGKEIQIPTRIGKIIGIEHGAIQQFLGIRYAYATRFGNPEPYQYKTETIQATTHAPIALQSHSPFESFYIGTDYEALEQTEFPQYLSITRPSQEMRTPLPVMIWIHGGSFVNGSGENPEYDPSPLVEQENVIVVNLSYRLGVLGFLRNQQGELANLGILDQIEGLKWVKRNIKDFGGNPENITIFGQSSGGESVRALMVADGTEFLFQRAIIQSAPIGLMKGRHQMTLKMLEALKSLDRHADLSDFKKMQTFLASNNEGKGFTKLMPFGPHYGVYPLPKEADLPSVIAQRAPHIDLLIGHTSREVNVFIYMNTFQRQVSALPVLKWGVSGIIKLLTRSIYAKPAYTFYREYMNQSGHAYYYQFNWLKKEHFFSAGHSSELALLFNTEPYMKSPLFTLLSEETIETAGRTMKKIWGSFARSGHIEQQQYGEIIEILSK
ncbi:carboxylesterase family protein [Staphylococcus ratti]|uniref:Carboxylic ester hydrolase n=1 Tax=Staphylococcus ratti TaxID=2892440 RepID=A0ABY3PEN6_9STAP|nr:carboxylesterase family protein [Staphylococcus ratti]UEX90796.1 carboxylesterase family protein [Staphylococcus ratti]